MLLLVRGIGNRYENNLQFCCRRGNSAYMVNILGLRTSACQQYVQQQLTLTAATGHGLADRACGSSNQVDTARNGAGMADR